MVVLAIVVWYNLPVRANDNPKGTEDCAVCHEEHVKAFLMTRHAVLDSKGLSKKANADFSCVGCHGDPSKHIEAGGGKGTMFSFSKADPSLKKSKQCLACHSDNHGRFFSSQHAKAAMDCTSCHSIHNTKGSGNKATCTGCHADIASKFSLNERHRLKEGILECTTCHNPHEAAGRERLGGFKDETCFKCHTDKQGPFVFEHGASKFEGCHVCHDPHGSPNRHMLAFQNVSDLCYSCHAMQPTFHSRFNKDTRCTNCHSSIHGSNLSNVFIK